MISEAIKGFVEGAVKPILDKFITDADKRLEAEQMIYTQAHEISLGQLEINKVEAGSSSFFVSGWRPFIGWVCGTTFAYSVVGRDFLNWALSFSVLLHGKVLPVLPAVDTTLTMELLFALLGLGGMRSWEKLKGLTK